MKQQPLAIGPFEGPSREIAARKTGTKKRSQPVIGGAIFEQFALVDVVVNKDDSRVIAPESSFLDILKHKGRNCAVVTIIYCDTESFRRKEENELDIFSEIEAKSQEWRDSPELIELANRESVDCFWALHRSTPVQTSSWATIGGCFLEDGILTSRDQIKPLTIDEIWSLWRKGSWGTPEPANDYEFALLSNELGEFLANCGWESTLDA